MIGEDNFMVTTAGSLLSKQHQIRMEMRRYLSNLIPVSTPNFSDTTGIFGTWGRRNELGAQKSLMLVIMLVWR